MDANVGAADNPQDPDRRAFEEITAHLDLDLGEVEAVDVAPAGDRPESPPPPQTPPPAPVPIPDQGRAAVTPPEDPMPIARPAGVVEVLHTAQRLAVREPVAPNYWGARGLTAVYWIAILTGAIGQVIFFGELFDMGWPGYVAAAIIATTAETVMVSSGDTALANRAKGRRTTQWVPFLLIAFLAAFSASGMNLVHWWSENPSMAVIFGGIAFLGFVLHVIHGFGEGTEYLAERDRFEQRIAEQEAEARAAELAREQRARREHEAQLESRERQAPTAPAPQPPASAATTRADTERAPAPQPRKTPPAAPDTTKAAKAAPAAQEKVSKDEVLAWALRQDATPTPSEVLAHFKGTGRPLPTDRAIRGWLSAIRP